MEERLRYIFANTNEWLKFAETKNAGLLVFAAAAIVGAQRSTSTETLTGMTQWALTLGTILLAAAAVLCLLSFIPQVRIPWLDSARAPTEEDNLLFYGHIADYRPTEYLAKLRTASNAQTAPTPIEDHYAQQIVTNARIAVRKYKCFNVAAYLAIAGGIFILAAAPLTKLWD